MTVDLSELALNLGQSRDSRLDGLGAQELAEMADWRAQREARAREASGLAFKHEVHRDID
ncbi:MAG: hypothetical protein H6922_03360 [Pseudomonadaceae bacterium]|nr:hypothetical protein [Pseudomonadaceae bacterium]